MNLSVYSILWAFLYASFGLGLTIIPVQFMNMYDVLLDADGALMARILGASLLAFALSFYLNRKIPLSDSSWKNLILASFIYNIIDIPIVVQATLQGVMNTMGWFPVSLHIFLAASMGYFVFRK